MIFRKGGSKTRTVAMSVRVFSKDGNSPQIVPSDDSDLAKLIRSWNQLPANIRQAILMMIEI